MVKIYNNLPKILTYGLTFIPDRLQYVSTMANMVLYDFTNTNYMADNHTTNSSTLNGRLSIICIFNNVGVPSLIF